MTALLELDRVSKRFGGLLAVHNLSFAMREGEILGLIGPNGAGKSTLFNLINGVFTPNSGRIVFNAAAALVGLDDRLHLQALHLTIAGKKRLELARALAAQPKLLLLDEVLAGLNPTEIDHMIAVIRRIR